MIILTRLWDKLNPLKKEIQEGEKLSRILLLGLSFFAILNLYDFCVFVIYAFQFEGIIDSAYWINLIGLLLLPLALFLFVKRKNLGWTLLGSYMFFMLFSFLYDLFLTYLWSETAVTDGLNLNKTDYINYRLLLYSLLILGALFLLFRPAVKALYRVKSSQAFGVLLFGILLIGLLIYMLFI